MTAELAQIRRLASGGSLEQALLLAKKFWLDHEESVEVVKLFAEIISKEGRSGLAKKLLALIKQTGSLPKSKTQDQSQPEQSDHCDQSDQSEVINFSEPLPIFEAGYALTDARQFELAAMLLKRCATMVPDDPVINYELGFALMSIGKLPEAINYFEKAAAEKEDFDTRLNLAACYTLCRKLDKSREATGKLTALARSKEEKAECKHREMVLKRLALLAPEENFNARDWLYVLYGNAILLPQHTAISKHDKTNIAQTLLILQALLNGINIDLKIIEYYNVKSRPLAKALGKIMGLAIDSYKGSRKEKTLIVMDWASDIIGPHKSFTKNEDQRMMFAYALSNNQALPVMPDIIGCLAGEAVVPWDDELTGAGEDALSSEIVSCAQALEKSADRAIEDTILYYQPKLTTLVLNNSSIFLQRPEYSAEIQSK